MWGFLVFSKLSPDLLLDRARDYTCIYNTHTARMHIHSCTYTQTHTLTSKFISIYVENHEFTPIPTMPIQHYRIHSSPIPFLLSLSITASLTVRKLAFIVLNTLVIVSVKNTSAGWGQAVSAAWQKVSEPKVGEEGGHLCRGREVSGPK